MGQGVSSSVTGYQPHLNSDKTKSFFSLEPNSKEKKYKILESFSCLILDQDTNPSASAETFDVVFDSKLI